jgi:tripartite-type tricarboxylate transporter receptor subunit TctC
MKKPGLRFLARPTASLCVLATMLVALSGHSAWPQRVRTIKIVVPFAAGGVTDVVARLLGEQITRVQGPTLLIENRTGAGGGIGAETVSRAAPDGNALLVSTADFLAPRQTKLNYDPVTSFESICYPVNTPLVFAVNSASSYNTLANLLDTARGKPGDLTIASVGPETALQIGVEMLMRAGNVKMIYVPYAGGAPVVNALLGGHVTSALLTYTSSGEHLTANRLRALAATTRARIEALPEVPTVAESGYKDYELDFWVGLFAPANTRKETVAQIAGWFTAALQGPETRRSLVAVGAYPVGMCGADFAALVRKQSDVFGRIARDLNVNAK